MSISMIISVCPLQISTSIKNYFCDSVFWRHLWCFNRVRGPLVTAPDLFCVQCIQQQGRACLSTLNALGHSYTMSCTLYTCLFCVFIVQCLLLNSTCTWSRLWGWITLADTCTVHRVPCTVYLAPCTLHRAPCTHRATKPHHRQSRGLSRKIWTAPPLLQRPFIPTADAGPASQISIRSDRSL